MESPIFELNGMWYFWDESWSYEIGPFHNVSDVRQAYNKYCSMLEYNDMRDEKYWERKRSGKEE